MLLMRIQVFQCVCVCVSGQTLDALHFVPGRNTLCVLLAANNLSLFFAHRLVILLCVNGSAAR